MYKRRKYLLTAPPLCSALPLKTEVYARGAGCNFDFAATNGTVVACDGLAKITITHNNNGSTLPAGAIIEYRLDMETWQTSNVITGVSYADHVVSIRMTNGSQICYATKNLAAVLFSDCGVLSCDFRIVAKDGTNNETSTLARDPATKGLKTLKLSLESFDGSDLSKGVTYYWERFAKNPNDAGGSKVFVSSQAAVSIGAVGRYTVALVRGSITCTTEIAINSKPCLDTPEPTTKCETKALTGVSDEIANRLTDLAVGDVVRCGDFNVTITEATGGPFEGWTGKGYVTVPYVNATVSIILKKAVFNDCYQLTNANATAELPTVFTEYDAKWKNIFDLDDLEGEILRLYDEIKETISNYNNSSQKDLQAKIDRLNELKTQVNNSPNFAPAFKTDLIKVADNAVNAGTCTKNSTPAPSRISSSERIESTQDCNITLIEKEDFVSKYYKISTVETNLQPAGGTLPSDVASVSYFTLTRMVTQGLLVPSSDLKPVVEFVDAAGNTVRKLQGYFIGSNRYANYSDNGDADIFYVSGRWYYRKFDLSREYIYYYEPTTRKWINFVPTDFPKEDFYAVMRDYGPGLAAFADKWEQIVVGVCGTIVGAPILQGGRWALTFYLANSGLQVGMTAFRDEFKQKFSPTALAYYDLIQVSLILTSIYQAALSNEVTKIGTTNVKNQIIEAKTFIKTKIPSINNAISAIEATIAAAPAKYASYKEQIEKVVGKMKSWIKGNSQSIITNRDELATFLDQVDDSFTVDMVSQKGIKSFFRGTTRRSSDNNLFPGNENTQKYGLPTSVDPIKATIFAVESRTLCATKFPEYNKASVIIGLPSSFNGIKCEGPSRRVFDELEVAIGISAENYANLATVEISADDARLLIKKMYNVQIPASLTRAEADILLQNHTFESPSLEKSFLFYKKSIPFNIK